MSLVATLICAPLLIMGSTLLLMLLVMVDRPDRPVDVDVTPEPFGEPEIRRAA